MSDVASVRGRLPLITPPPTQAALLVNLMAKIREGEMLVMMEEITVVAMDKEIIVAGWPKGEIIMAVMMATFFCPQIPRMLLALPLRRTVLKSIQCSFTFGYYFPSHFGLDSVYPASASSLCFP